MKDLIARMRKDAEKLRDVALVLEEGADAMERVVAAQRYDLEGCISCGEPWQEMVKADDGDWIKVADLEI